MELASRRCRPQVPHAQLVVVASRGQLLLVVAPLQPTHLLPVPREPGAKVPFLPHVPVQDVVVSAACAQDGAVPRHGAYATSVPRHRPQLAALGGVPYLHLPFVGAHRQMSPSLRPTDRGDGILGPKVAELGHPAGASIPEVHTTAQADAQEVGRRPIDQVQVEVVLQLWRIQDLERDLGDFPGHLPRRVEELAVVERHRRERERIVRTHPGVRLESEEVVSVRRPQTHHLGRLRRWAPSGQAQHLVAQQLAPQRRRGSSGVLPGGGVLRAGRSTVRGRVLQKREAGLEIRARPGGNEPVAVVSRLVVLATASDAALGGRGGATIVVGRRARGIVQWHRVRCMGTGAADRCAARMAGEGP
mmetsp:Transcript_63313/g.181645  ORF Transcript_63313/g.181645 Transcript_63313/m.181645 type:complete len:360 (+) Transcript_63313:650-1729(+)